MAMLLCAAMTAGIHHPYWSVLQQLARQVRHRAFKGLERAANNTASPNGMQRSGRHRAAAVGSRVLSGSWQPKCMEHGSSSSSSVVVLSDGVWRLNWTMASQLTRTQQLRHSWPLTPVGAAVLAVGRWR
jgi:hypothetical protein